MDHSNHDDNGGPSTQQSDGASLAAAASPHHEADEHEESGHEGPDDASKKRKRPPITACEVCKARKVKCDRAEPTCGWCARNGRVCVYRERQKPGFRAGYGRELEQKINRLEAMLHVLGRRVELHIIEHDSQKAGHSGAPIPDINSDTATIHMSSQSPSAGDSGRPVANGYDRTSYPRSSGPMSVQSMVNMNMMENGSHPEPPPAFGTSLGQEQSPDLPPYDLLYAVVDLYFKHVNPWCPILDRQVTLDRLFGPRILEEADRVLVHAIICAALRFSKDPRLTPESRLRYLELSRQKIFLFSFHNQGVPALQALMILAMDALGTSNGPQSGNLLAVIIRCVLQLGLHYEKGVHLTSPSHPSIGTLQDFIIPPPSSWIEDEARRRLFWMAYILDRYESVASAKEFSLNELQTDRPLPCRYDLFSSNQPVETRRFVGPEQSDMVVNRPENLGSFSYHCDVLRILSRVHLFLRNPIDISSVPDVENWQNTYRQLDGELNTWLYNLPDDYSRISQLCHSSPTSRISNWIMLHAAFVIAVLRLHSCAAYPTVRSHLFAPSYNAMQRCLAAVESLREIAQDVVNTGMLDLLGPHFAFALWVSARVLLVHAAATGDDVNSNIGFFISTLEKMGYYWDVARRYAQILDRVLQEYQESKRPAAVVLTSPSTPPPNSLADMRRSAYNLSFLLGQKSSSVLQPPSLKTPGPNELEYFDIFDFFNYPRLAGPPVSEPLPPNMETPSVDKGQFVSTNFSAPASDPDWLSFRPPHE